jgi:hypothetical protein
MCVTGVKAAIGQMNTADLSKWLHQVYITHSEMSAAWADFKAYVSNRPEGQSRDKNSPVA